MTFIRTRFNQNQSLWRQNRDTHLPKNSKVLQHGKMGSFLGVLGRYGFLVKSKSNNGQISLWSEQFHRHCRK